MKHVIVAILLATTLSGCYVGIRSPIYGGFDPPLVVEQGPPVAPPPPGPYLAPPPYYPYVPYGPYGYWGGGWYSGHYWRRGYYGHGRGRHWG